MLILLAIVLGAACSTANKTTREGLGPAVFKLRAPGAKQVHVVGTFNGWNLTAHPLDGPDRDGVWSLRIGLPPGRYRYMFVVDGVRWVADPEAAANEDDGFGGRNSLLVHGR